MDKDKGQWIKSIGSGIIGTLKWIKKIFEDASGVPSSKRIQSFLLLAFGCFLAWKKYDWNLVATVLGVAAALQGVTAFQKPTISQMQQTTYI